MSRYRTLLPLGAVVLVVGLASLIATGVVRPAPPTPTPSATETPPSVDLSGAWLGLCTGPFNGFCSVTWTQTANSLDGTFMLSSPPDTLHISGNLTGSTISFGAVGVVTFTGSLSGSTMSGSYTDIANGKTGSWTVTLSP
jgi:hypothetical protein